VREWRDMGHNEQEKQEVLPSHKEQEKQEVLSREFDIATSTTPISLITHG